MKSLDEERMKNKILTMKNYQLEQQHAHKMSNTFVVPKTIIELPMQDTVEWKQSMDGGSAWSSFTYIPSNNNKEMNLNSSLEKQKFNKT